MPTKRSTDHQARTQILADDSEDIDASDYGNDSYLESEISADSCHDSDSMSESDADKSTATQPHACPSSRDQVHGRRHGTGRVAQSERERGAANNWGPELSVTMSIVTIVEITKQRNIKKIKKKIIN